MLINILSNIWFYPIITGIIKSREEQLLDIKKLQLEYNFTKIINLDDELKFWWLKEEKYLPEIQEQIDSKNYSKLEKKLKYYAKLITNTNINKPDEKLLFISINSIECMYAIHLYLFITYTEISRNNRDLTLNLINIIKEKYPFDITITDENIKKMLL